MEYSYHFGNCTYSAWCKNKRDRIKRVDILLNKTREEVAKDYVTKVELTISIDRVIDRLDKLDEKMDKLITG